MKTKSIRGKGVDFSKVSTNLLHDISSPLMAALLNLDQVKHNPSKSINATRASLLIMKRYIDAARKQMSGDKNGEVWFDVLAHLKHVQRIIRPIAKMHGVNIRYRYGENIKLFGDPIKFQQILSNLIINAVEAYESDLHSELIKKINVDISIENNCVKLIIIDWGEGIRLSQMNKIFEPFYTTKKMTSKGMGLGLAIIRQYVTEDYGGSISVICNSRAGTKFTVILPVNQ